MATKFKLVFFVPISAVEVVKAAVFAAGAGRYPGKGNYSECAWQTLGTGQFRPGDTAHPHIGKVGALEKVDEARVETICVGKEVAKNAVEALKQYVQARAYHLQASYPNAGLGTIRMRSLHMRFTGWKTSEREYKVD